MTLMYGLSVQTIEAIRSVLQSYPGVEKAVLYGSRAKGNFRTGSDIDLTLEGNTLDFKILFRIKEELDELMLPYRIDLSLLKYIQSPELLEEIERTGQVFYEKDSKAF